MTDGTITLRPWKESDAPRVLELFDNINVTRNLTANLPRPYRLEHAQEFVTRCCRAGEACPERAIEWQGETAGTIGARISGNLALIGYWLGEPYWGRRIMSRALPLYLAQLPGQVTQLRAYAFAFNAASQALLCRNGFAQQPGTFRARSYDQQEYDCLTFARPR